VGPEVAGAKALASYSVPLEENAVLRVTLPATLSTDHLIEVIDQLRELADSLAAAARLPEYEPAAREELLRMCDDLEEDTAVRFERDQDPLLVAYDQFREAVADYLRTVDR
jgi:hypothetical protein